MCNAKTSMMKIEKECVRFALCAFNFFFFFLFQSETPLHSFSSSSSFSLIHRDNLNKFEYEICFAVVTRYVNVAWLIAQEKTRQEIQEENTERKKKAKGVWLKSCLNMFILGKSSVGIYSGRWIYFGQTGNLWSRSRPIRIEFFDYDSPFPQLAPRSQSQSRNLIPIGFDRD